MASSSSKSSKQSSYDGDSSLNNSINLGRPQSSISSPTYDDESMTGPIIRKDNEDVSAWVKYKHCLRSMWATRETEQENLANREVLIKTTLRELIVYLFFLIFLSIVAFGSVSNSMFYMSDSVNNLFINRFMPNGYTTFNKLVKVQDYWTWLQNVTLFGLFWPRYYNGLSVQPNSSNWVFYESQMLGLPRIRQVRNFVNQGCTVAGVFAGYIPFCYNTWDHLSTGDPNFKIPTNALTGTSLSTSSVTAWSYSSLDQGIGYQGIVSYYENNGYSQLLTDRNFAASMLQVLKTNSWIDQGTRAVFVEFTLYNADVNLFSVVQMAAELPPSGGIVPSYQVRTVKLLRYETGFDYFILACEFLYLLFIVYYIVEEILEIKKLKLSYFKTFWNWLDLIIIVISILLTAYTIYRVISVSSAINNLISNPNQYADFTYLAFCQSQYQNVLALTVFFAYLKVFKYIGFNQTMKQLTTTLSRCSGELFCFAIMYFISFFAFAQLGYLLFGDTVYSFRTFSDSVCSLFRLMLGDFDLNGMCRSNSFLGPLYFICYLFFMIFILFQMFLAIINDSYATVKAEFALAKDQAQIGEYLKEKWDRLLQKLNLKKKEIIDIQHVLKNADKNSDGKIDFVEMRNELKRLGYADAEIEAVFARYDVDSKRKLGESEVASMQEKLEREKANVTNEINAISQVSKRGTTYQEYNVLVKRVERTESSISGIVSKIDAVLQKMEVLEKTKAQRREALNSVLETMKALGEDGGGDDEERRAQLESYVQGELDKWEDEKERPATSSGLGEGYVGKSSRPGSSRSK